jgi:hypothetical protein
MRPPFLALVIAVAGTVTAFTGSAQAALRVSWMAGARSPATPARLDRVGVIKVGPATARNVLVIEPGTSAGATYFVPLARWIAARAPGWQVWTVERRENLLEDQSVLDLAKRGRATATQVFDYYLGWLKDPSITHHLMGIAPAPYAKRWGVSVAVGDLHRVIDAARRLGGKVVLGGHSLGGGVVTAYATWDFAGRPGADGLAGLVYIDGGSFGPETAGAARAGLRALDAPDASPWEPFGGIPAPLAGVLVAAGSEAALIDPRGTSAGQASGLLTPFKLTPSVPLDNLAQFGYALNVGSSPAPLIGSQAHLGAGITSSGSPRAWNSTGALTPIVRYAQMFSGAGVSGADGSEWYFPQRLTIDLGGVGDGTASPAQRALGLRTTLGRRLPHSLRIYAFGARLGGRAILSEAATLARQSHIPRRQVTLVDRHGTYAHNDPIGAFPRNAFVSRLIPFLKRTA